MYALFFLIILFFSSNTLTMKPSSQNICISVEKDAIEKKVGQKISWHTNEYVVTQRDEDTNHVTMIFARPTHKLIGIPLIQEYVTRQFNKSDRLSNHGTVSYALSQECQKILATTATLSLVAVCFFLDK